MILRSRDPRLPVEPVVEELRPTFTPVPDAQSRELMTLVGRRRGRHPRNRPGCRHLAAAVRLRDRSFVQRGKPKSKELNQILVPTASAFALLRNL
jgi:hypothetical protein